MNTLNRRRVVQLGVAAFSSQSGLAGGIPFPAIARVTARLSASIAASPLSVGFETLDRKLFDPERAYPHLEKLGVKWARVQTGWARTERTKGEYEFSWLEQIVDGLLKIGIQPWFNLGYGNRLYTPEAPHETAVGYVPLNTPEARQARLAFTQRIAERFRSRVRHWEIWNEPNIAGFWRPNKPDPAGYVELIKMTASEIRKRVPNAVIIGGVLAGLPYTFDYLKSCLDAGLAKYIDKVSYHPYQAIPEANYDCEMTVLRSLLSSSQRGIGIWQGENGASSEKGGTGHPFELDGTEAAQAKWVTRRVLSDLRVGVELTSVFHTIDLVNYIWSSGPSGKTQHMGLLRADYTPKPAYFAYQTLCALFDSESKRADLLAVFRKPVAPGSRGRPADVEGVYSATFVRRGAPVVAYWRPADLSIPYSPVEVSVLLWSGDAAEMSEPILIDPISGQAHRVEGAERNGGYWQVPRVPLLDYPLLLGDKRLLYERA